MPNNPAASLRQDNSLTEVRAMSMRSAVLRILIITGLLVGTMVGAGFGAAGGSSTVTITASAGIDITVPVSASISSTAPGTCGTTSGGNVNVKSNKAWNLQVRSEPSTYPNGKAKDGGTELTSAFQYKGGDIVAYSAITSSYTNLFTSNQAKTTGAGVDVAMNYQQCVDYSDSPGTYLIVVEYLGVQP